MGEAKAIRWSNIKSDHIVVEGTKTTAAHRIIPIWGQLRELLNNIKDTQSYSERRRLCY